MTTSTSNTRAAHRRFDFSRVPLAMNDALTDEMIPVQSSRPQTGATLTPSITRPSSPTSPVAQSASDTSMNMPQHTSRDVGDPSQIRKNKQSMADLKLRRLTELNNRLREDLERERIPVSAASKR
jgi:hypothetical protein